MGGSKPKENEVIIKARIEESRRKLEKLEPVLDLFPERLRHKISSEGVFINTMEFLEKGLSPTEIANALDLPPRTVSGWIYEGKEPLGAMNVPDFRLTKDLVKILAATNTDAEVEGTFIRLRVVDYGLAKEYAKSLSSVLGEKAKLTIYESTPGVWNVDCSSAFLAAVANKVIEDPELIHRFLIDEHAKTEYCRFFLAFDGGPSIRFDERDGRIQVFVSVNEDKDTLSELREIFEEFGIESTGPHSRTNVYYLGIYGEENVSLFAERMGIEGYKDEKLKDAIWLIQRVEARTSEGMGKVEALDWARNLWETYYCLDGTHGWVPRWWKEAYDVAHSDMLLEDKVKYSEEIYQTAESEGRNLRSSIRY